MEKKTIEAGDYFYINLYTLSAWGITTESIFTPTAGYLRDFKEHSRMLLKLKYLGDGIAEEVTTGEKLIMYGQFDRFENCKFISYYSDRENAKFADDYYTKTNYIDYLIDNKDDTKGVGYVEGIKNALDIIEKYPIIVFDVDGVYLEEEVTTKDYDKYDDGFRNVIIKELKKDSLYSVFNARKRIKEYFNCYISIQEEMAYLEKKYIKEKTSLH